VKSSWIIVVLPLLSFFVILLFGKRMPRGGAEVGIVAVLIGFVLSLIVASHFWGGNNGAYEAGITWINFGSFKVQLSEHVDGLASMMFVVVTLVSLMVHVYSLGYMHGDRRFTFFYAALSLFTAAMLNLVVADNTLQLLVGWELVGLCSFMLIGHWWEEQVNSDSAIKAFITTRIGDVGLTIGIVILFFAACAAMLSGGSFGHP